MMELSDYLQGVWPVASRKNVMFVKGEVFCKMAVTALLYRGRYPSLLHAALVEFYYGWSVTGHSNKNVLANALKV